MKSLDAEAVKRCTKCVTLGADQVPAEGSPQASIMFIGQSPGAVEAKQGRPFCGPSGELLTFLIEEIGISRNEAYITNALKCRPPENRPGHKEELSTCFDTWLFKEIRVVNPKIIVLLGKDAWQSVTKGKVTWGHGVVTKTKTRTYVCLYHPSYFLRNGDVEGFVSQGKKIKELYDEVASL